MSQEEHLIAQGAAGMVAADQAVRTAGLRAAMERQDEALAAALESVNRVREFVGTPERILGSDATKHGEIAEQVEVGIRNARDLLRQVEPKATFEGVGRTAPEDYLVDGVQVQSKFINGVNATLDHVLEHMRNYPNFGRDGSYYHIPKDQMELVRKILEGEAVEGVSARTAHAIVAKVNEIERLSGDQAFDAVVRPSLSKYAEVQQGKIHETLDNQDQELRAENSNLRDRIVEQHQPGWEELVGAAGKGALIGAGVRLTVSLYRKIKQGKNPFVGEFSAEDWKEVGGDTLVGSVQGGIAGGAIYALTQYADMAAPFAGAFVSSAMSVASLAQRYSAGDISFEQFVELGMVACAEGAVVGIASAIGQALIPVPALGALVGAVAGRWLLSLAGDHLREENEALGRALKARYEAAMAKLDTAYQAFVEEVVRTYEQLGSLVDAAFDMHVNQTLRLSASIRLAEVLGVEGDRILRTTKDVDAFILGQSSKQPGSSDSTLSSSRLGGTT